MSRSRLRLTPLLLLLVFLAPALARAEERPAMKSKAWLALYRGDYKGAQKEFEAEFAKSPDDLAVVLGINRLRIETGQYEEAEKHLTEYLAAKDSLLVRRALVKVLLRRGRLKEALAHADAVLAKQPGNTFGLVVRGQVLEERGQYDEAESAYQAVMDVYWSTPDLLQQASPDPDLLYDIAVAGSRAGTRTGDSGTLQTVVDQVLPAVAQADKYYYDAYLLEAFLYLDKNNAVDAAKTFRQVTDFNKYHPEARIGLAVYNLQKYALDEAEREVARALKINPQLVPALHLQAMLHLFDEEYDAARKHLERAATINPADLDTLGLLGALHQYQGDAAALAAVEKSAAALNPRCARFYHHVGRICIRTLRFTEAEVYLRKAVELDPKDWGARNSLGMCLLHQGREKEAYEEINLAFQNDSFQAEAYNTLQLFDLMKEEFIDHEEGKFLYRMAKTEEPVMLPYLSRLIARADATLGKKYGIETQGPILIEMFPKYQDFSVRTAGVVGIGALGACFGKVCTLLSPAGQKQFGVFNWARVTWHEYAHVVTLQKSKGRVPRWLTEGLSVYEEKEHRPDWAREMELELYDARRKGMLLGLGELNRGFTRPKWPGQVILCYFHASLVCDYIAGKYGFEKIVAMLEAYGAGSRTPKVVKDVLGVEIPEFDRDFFAWLDQRLGTLQVPPAVSEEEKDALEAKVAADAKDAAALAKLAWYHLGNGAAAEAQTMAQRAVDAAPGNGEALAALGYLAHGAGKKEEARGHLDAAVKAGAGYYGVHLRLGMLHQAAKRNPEAIAAFEAAKKAYPNRAEKDNNPYQFLAQIYEAAGETDKQIAELEALRAIDQDDSGVRRKLAELHTARGKHDLALRALEEANEVHPLDVDLHVEIGRAHRALQQFDAALAEYGIAVSTAQAMNRRGNMDERIGNLYCDMAEIAIDKKDLDEAERYVDDALYLFPKLERGDQLHQKIARMRR